MTTEGDGTLHVNDVDIVRWLDTELAEPDRFTHETHVSGCAACSARQAAVARRATRVSNLLREIDLPTPTTALRIAVVPRLEPVAIRWRIAVVEGERVTAEASRGRPVPGLLVFPNELRMGADADSVADYVVRVPVRLEVVRIVIGGAREEVFQPSAPGERRTFALRPPGAP